MLNKPVSEMAEIKAIPDTSIPAVCEFVHLPSGGVDWTMAVGENHQIRFLLSTIPKPHPKPIKSEFGKPRPTQQYVLRILGDFETQSLMNTSKELHLTKLCCKQLFLVYFSQFSIQNPKDREGDVQFDNNVQHWLHQPWT